MESTERRKEVAMSAEMGVVIELLLGLTILVGILAAIRQPTRNQAATPQTLVSSSAASAAARKTFVSLVTLAKIAEESWKHHERAQPLYELKDSDHALPWIIPPSLAPIERSLSSKRG